MALVLVVEDDDDIAELLCLKLRGMGHTVLAASNGRDGIDLCVAHLPDLVLMDWMMPVLDGVAAVREIRRTPRTAQVPVIMLTARSAPEDLDEGTAAGVDDYVSKPFSLRDVAARVEAVLVARGVA